MKVTVLGGGNGAHAAAADLSLKGFEISVFSRWPEEWNPLQNQGGIDLIDAAGEKRVPIFRVCETIREAMEGPDFILIAVPATAHEYYAHACAPCLRKGQVIVLNPGSTGGALAFSRILRERKSADVTVCETNTLTYICRLIGPAKVKVTSHSKVGLAAFPGKRTRECFHLFKKLYPEAMERKNVLETSLTNINAVLHPPGMVLNAGWVEKSGGGFAYYYDGTTPAVARVIEAVDRERMALCGRLGFATESFLDFFYRAGSTTGEAYRSGSVYRALQESEPNRFIRAPESLTYRFLSEDVPFGLVPMAFLGESLEVPTPTIHALIDLASLINQTDYRETGWTPERMGIAGMDRDRLLHHIENG